MLEDNHPRKKRSGVGHWILGGGCVFSAGGVEKNVCSLNERNTFAINSGAFPLARVSGRCISGSGQTCAST